MRCADRASVHSVFLDSGEMVYGRLSGAACSSVCIGIDRNSGAAGADEGLALREGSGGSGVLGAERRSGLWF